MLGENETPALVFFCTPKPTVDVAVGVIWRGTFFLAAKRPKGYPRAGYWELPGGKRDAGESISAALTRELQEELGIEVLEWRLWKSLDHVYDDLRVSLHFMHVIRYAGNPQGLEGQDLRWLTVQEALNLPFLAADLRVLPDLAPPLK